MSISRGIDGAEPLRPDDEGRVVLEERRIARTSVVAHGTLACPHCDAPVAPEGAMSPADPLGCPFCAHQAAARDFLSLSTPGRPARVVVRLRVPARL